MGLFHFQNQFQNPFGAVTNLLLTHSSVGDSFQDGLGIAVGHLQVVASVDLPPVFAPGPPVGGDDAVEAPLVPEDVGEQLFSLRGLPAVDQVVAGHDHPGLGLLHRDFKALQI